MNRPDEYDAESYPHQAGKPAPALTGQDWSCDRSCSRDSREMLGKEVEWAGRDEVDSVALGVCRRELRIVDLELLLDSFAIDEIGRGE